MAQTEQLVIRLSKSQKDELRLLSKAAGVSMAKLIIKKLKLGE